MPLGCREPGVAVADVPGARRRVPEGIRLPCHVTEHRGLKVDVVQAGAGRVVHRASDRDPVSADPLAIRDPRHPTAESGSCLHRSGWLSDLVLLALRSELLGLAGVWSIGTVQFAHGALRHALDCGCLRRCCLWL